LIEKFSRKKILLVGIAIKILLWIPIMLTGLLFYYGVPHMVWALIALVGIYHMIAMSVHPAWFSWMGSIVPEKERGRYFYRRNRAIGFFSILSMVLGAIILDSAKNVGFHYGNVLGFTLLGFGLLFSVSAITRIWANELLRRQYEPKLHVKKKDYFSFWSFIRKCSSSSFGKFVVFRGFLSFTVAIAGPFWVVYMLRDLGFSYVWYMAVTVAGLSFQLMFLPLLGKISDKYGNVKLIHLSMIAIALTPFMWLVSPFLGNGLTVRFYLLIVPSVLAGFGWAGYNLAVNNYLYDAVRVSKQGFCVSYMNLVVGVAIFLGASVGSVLAWLNISFMNSILFIFLISGIGRLLVGVFVVRLLDEVRHVKVFYPRYLIKEFHPLQGTIREIHNLEHMVKKVEHKI
jgi:MFS family permease